MFFFEPYTPGEITFYGLLFGGYKLRKKLKRSMTDWENDYKSEQQRKSVAEWASHLNIHSLEDYEREKKGVDDLFLKGYMPVEIFRAKDEILYDIYLKLKK